MNKNYTLSNWSVISKSSRYVPPEQQIICLQGFREDDQRYVCTSRVMSSDKDKVKTYSGSTYSLKDPDPEYLQWLKDNDMDFDPLNPIKVKIV